MEQVAFGYLRQTGSARHELSVNYVGKPDAASAPPVDERGKGNGATGQPRRPSAQDALLKVEGRRRCALPAAQFLFSSLGGSADYTARRRFR